jgi:hypothetical protein
MGEALAKGKKDRPTDSVRWSRYDALGHFWRCCWRWGVAWNHIFMNDAGQDIPDSVLTAYFSLLLVGAVCGVLAGAKVLSGVGLGIFIFGALAIFVPWAIWKLNPELLKQESAYRGDN